MPLPPHVIGEWGTIQNRLQQGAGSLIRPGYQTKTLSEVNPTFRRGYNDFGETLENVLERSIREDRPFDPDTWGGEKAFTPENRELLKRYSRLLEVSGSAPGTRYDPGLSIQEAQARQEAEDKRQQAAQAGRAAKSTEATMEEVSRRFGTETKYRQANGEPLTAAQEKRLSELAAKYGSKSEALKHWEEDTGPKAARIIEPTGRTTYTTAEGKPLSKQEERELAIAFEEHGLVEEGRKAEAKAEKEAAERFRLENVSLKGGAISNEDWEKLPAKYQSIGLRAGLKAMQDTIEDDQTRYRKAEAALDSYKSGDGYDIARFLRDDPQGEQTLLDAGFTRAAIQQSRDYNRDTRGIGAKPGDKPSVSLDEFVETYFQDRGWDINRNKIVRQNKADKLIRKDLQAYDDKLQEASGAYREAYGTGAQILSGLGKAGYLIPAARAIAPEVEAKDISALEWGISAAQVALIATGVGGMVAKGAASKALNVAGVGLQAGLGGAVTAQIVQQWNNMTPAERTIGVGFDLLILGSLARSAPGINVKGISKGVAETLAKSRQASVVKPIEAKLNSLSRAMRLGDRQGIVQAAEDLTRLKGLDAKAQRVVNNLADHTKSMAEKYAEKPNIKITQDVKASKQIYERLLAETRELRASDVVASEADSQQAGLLAKGSREYKAGEIQPQEGTRIRKPSDPEELKLIDEISKDNGLLFELRNKGGEPYDIKQVADRIRENTEKLGKLQEAAKSPDNFTQAMDTRLKELGYSPSEIAALTDKDKLTLVANGIPPARKLEGPPKEKPGGAGGGRSRVAVKEKTETKTLTPEELDKLLEKEATKPETKPQVKPKPEVKTKTERRTSTDTEPFRVPQVVASPYKAVVWENGKIYVKTIEPTPLIQIEPFIRTEGKGKLKGVTQTQTEWQVDSKTGQVTARITRITTYTERQSKLAPQPQPGPKPKPRPQPVKARAQVKLLPEPKPAPIFRPTAKPTPTPIPKPVPQPQPQPQPRPQPIPTPEPTKPIPTPPIPGVKRDATGRIVAAPPGSVAWAQGKLANNRYFLYTPPYDKEHLFNLDYVPKGMKVYPNQREAISSIQKVSGGKIPTRRIDMGIQDLTVSETKGGKPRITFSRDVRQRTRGDVTLGPSRGRSTGRGMPRRGYASRKMGKIYHTKVGGGTVLSRRPLGKRRR